MLKEQLLLSKNQSDCTSTSMSSAPLRLRLMHYNYVSVLYHYVSEFAPGRFSLMHPITCQCVHHYVSDLCTLFHLNIVPLRPSVYTITFQSDASHYVLVLHQYVSV